MNRYGVILNSVGLYGMMTSLQQLLFDTRFCERKFGSVGGAWDRTVLKGAAHAVRAQHGARRHGALTVAFKVEVVSITGTLCAALRVGRWTRWTKKRAAGRPTIGSSRWWRAFRRVA